MQATSGPSDQPRALGVLSDDTSDQLLQNIQNHRTDLRISIRIPLMIPLLIPLLNPMLLHGLSNNNNGADEECMSFVSTKCTECGKSGESLVTTTQGAAFCETCQDNVPLADFKESNKDTPKSSHSMKARFRI